MVGSYIGSEFERPRNKGSLSLETAALRERLNRLVTLSELSVGRFSFSRGTKGISFFAQ